jgi:hypothetical protein
LALAVGIVTAGISACEKDSATAPVAAKAHRDIAGITMATKFDSVSLDEELLAIDRLSPGFGGMYLDTAGTLVIVHTRPGALAEAVDAIRQVMGDVPQLHAPHIVLRLGKFAFSVLTQFSAKMQSQLDQTGVVWSDVDEVNNRVTFGVVDNAAAQHVVAAAIAARLPAEAIAAITVPRFRPASTLLDRQDTLSGGLQLGFTNGGACTLGYLATRWGTARYMMTAGHCTPQMGSVDTSFWAANAFAFVRHGQEAMDPPYLAWGYVPQCPKFSLCRNSDAAEFYWPDSSQTYGLGLIATPAIMDTIFGSYHYPLTIYTHFNVVGEAPDSWLIPGAKVSKIGVTTGFTGGRITEACVTYQGVPSQGYNLACQVKAAIDVQSGDSGGPLLFDWPTVVAPPGVSTAYLAGMTSSSTGTGIAIFSSIGGITRDFGSMRTYPGKPCC